MQRPIYSLSLPHLDASQFALQSYVNVSPLVYVSPCVHFQRHERNEARYHTYVHTSNARAHLGSRNYEAERDRLACIDLEDSTNST